mmetsp:Transcript_12475/g.34389  ORF Transcript_12475/g.34389 Transcript_12475/m.34389 type:complete len:225 (+) Transcript_12475:309-983(+)
MPGLGRHRLEPQAAQLRADTQMLRQAMGRASLRFTGAWVQQPLGSSKWRRGPPSLQCEAVRGRRCRDRRLQNLRRRSRRFRPRSVSPSCIGTAKSLQPDLRDGNCRGASGRWWHAAAMYPANLLPQRRPPLWRTRSCGKKRQHSAPLARVKPLRKWSRKIAWCEESGSCSSGHVSRSCRLPLVGVVVSALVWIFCRQVRRRRPCAARPRHCRERGGRWKITRAG